MKHLDEYRDADLCRQLSRHIARVADGREITLMEVCGTHTMAIFQYGINDLLPDNIRLLSGPGCPVCVTPNEYLDRAVAYCRQEGVWVATFGDMLRVPGSRSSLVRERGAGGRVRLVYSPDDALELARQLPDQQIVFLGIGFETTSPLVAAVLADARRRKIENFFVLAGNKILPPALRALVDDEGLDLQGLICPGHVSAVTGMGIYEFLARDHGIACVISGFEPTDILQSILMLIAQILEERPGVENQYRRVVPAEGNPRARELIEEVFQPGESVWRGMGSIPDSGLFIRPAYQDHDAAAALPVEVEPPIEHPGCICGQILRGRKRPPDCGLFAGTCTPEHPVGACMVSSEGTCAAQYRYRRHETN